MNTLGVRMNRGYAALASVLLAVLLSGCFGDEKLDAKNEKNFERSYNAVTKSLSPGDQKRFDLALQRIVLVRLRTEMSMQQRSKPPAQMTDTVSDGLADSLAEGVVTKMIVGGWEEVRTKLVTAQAGTAVDGLTAIQVIQLADQEERRARQSTLAMYLEQRKQAEAALEDAKKRLAVEQTKIEAAKTALAAIALTNPKFEFHSSYGISEPAISFVIANKSKTVIRRIFVRGVLQTPGRAVPWVDDTFNYEMQGGLEPGEKQQLDLAPNMFGEWSKVPKNVVAGAVLTLTLVNVENAAGEKIVKDAALDGHRDRVKSLENGVRELNSKIEELQRQLGT